MSKHNKNSLNQIHAKKQLLSQEASAIQAWEILDAAWTADMEGILLTIWVI